MGRRESIYDALSVWHPRNIWREINNPLFWHDVLFEVIITAVVSCTVIWVLVSLAPPNSGFFNLTTTHLALFAATLIFSFSEGYATISGTFFNPAVAFAFFLTGRISIARLVFFTIAEIAGSACGALIALQLVPHDYRVATKDHPTGLRAIQPPDSLPAPNAMVIEAILTFNSVMVALSVTSARRAHSMPFLPIGFAVGVGIFSAGSFSGGLQNPIIAFGPAVASKNFVHHWLYWAGAYIGATVAALCFGASEYMRKRYEPHEEIIENPDSDLLNGLKLEESGMSDNNRELLDRVSQASRSRKQMSSEM